MSLPKIFLLRQVIGHCTCSFTLVDLLGSNGRALKSYKCRLLTSKLTLVQSYSWLRLSEKYLSDKRFERCSDRPWLQLLTPMEVWSLLSCEPSNFELTRLLSPQLLFPNFLQTLILVAASGLSSPEAH